MARSSSAQLDGSLSLCKPSGKTLQGKGRNSDANTSFLRSSRQSCATSAVFSGSSYLCLVNCKGLSEAVEFTLRGHEGGRLGSGGKAGQPNGPAVGETLMFRQELEPDVSGEGSLSCNSRREAPFCKWSSAHSFSAPASPSSFSEDATKLGPFCTWS